MFGSVRFSVYTPTIQFVFPLFAFPFASCFVLFDVGMMGVTSKCIASRDNLIKKKKKKLLYGYFVSVYSVCSGC